MKSVCGATLFFILLTGAFILPSTAATGPYAYISNSGDNTVSVIDTSTNAVVATVPVETSPWGVAVNQAGTRAYVANSYDAGTVSVIDIATNSVVSTVRVGSYPIGVAVNQSGTMAYVTNGNSNNVSVIDTSTNTVVATVGVGPYGTVPEGVAVNPAGTRVYVANYNKKTVSVIDTSTNTVVATVGVGSNPFGVAVNPAGTRVYVANEWGSNVSVINTATNTVVATIPVGENIYGLAVNPAGTRVYVTNLNSNNVAVIDTTTNTVVATVGVGSSPQGVAVNATGTMAYVTNSHDNTVSVIDTATNTVVATVPVGSSPTAFGQFIAPSDTMQPDCAIAYPANGAAISGATCTITGTATDNVAVQRVEISLDNGASWATAYGTSGDDSWSTWAYDWPLAKAGSYKIKARAFDTSNNVYTTGAVTVAVDLTGPTSHITLPANGAYIKTVPVTITGTAADNIGGTGVASVWVSTDRGETYNPAAGTTSWSYRNWTPEDGVYTILCYAVDKAGNLETLSQQISVTVDTTPPTSSIADPVGSQILKGTAYNITGTADDDSGSGAAKVEVSTNGGTTYVLATDTSAGHDWSAWSYTWTLGADGPYTLKSRATDKAGKVETPGAGVAVKVDKTKPTVAITAPAANTWVKGTSFIVTGTASDATSGLDKVEVSVDGSWNPVSTGTASWTYNWNPLPSDGTHTLQARATDKTGNVQTTAIISVKVDGTAPSSTMTQPLDGGTLSGATYAIKGTAKDAYSGVKKVEIGITPKSGGSTAWYAATGTASWGCTWTLPAVIADYIIQTRATDNAGNVETPGAGVTVTANKNMPRSAITAPAAGKALRGASATIAGTASCIGATVSKVEVKVVSPDTSATVLDWTQATGTTAWKYTWMLPVDGNYTILSRATNSLAVTEDASHKATIAVTVDNTKPGSTITIPADGSILKGTTVAITGTTSDEPGSGVAKVEVSTTNGSTWVAATDTSAGHDWSSWSYTWTLGADGPYTLKSRATDKAGNVQISFTPVSVRVDKTKPTVTLTAPLNGVSISKALNNWSITGFPITGTASDGATGSGVALVEVGITPAGGATTWFPATGTTSWSYPWMLPADGSYNVKARSTDNAGNVSLIAAGNTVKVDGTPPSVDIKQPLNGVTLNGTSCAMKGTASDNLSGVKKVEVGITPPGGSTAWYRGVGTTAWSYTWNMASIPATGSFGYGIECRVTDNAGNTSTSQITVTVDKTMPASVITAPAAGKALGGASATITGTATAGASGGTVTMVEVKVINADTNATVLDWTRASGTTAWTYTWKPLPPDGSYIIMSRATNSLGNFQGTTPQWGTTVTVDATPPTSVITDPAAGDVLKGTTVPVTGTADDGSGSGVARVEVSTNGGSTYVLAKDASAGHDWSSWSYTWTLGADGPYVLKSRVTDKAGDIGYSSTVSVRIDKTKPTSAITSPPNGAFLKGMPITITGTASDGATGSGVSLVEVGITPAGGSTVWSPVTTGTTSWSYSWTPSDGSYNIKCRATDNGGNVQTPGAGNTVQVDNTPPAVAITAPADGTLINTSLTNTVNGQASDGGSGLLKVEVSKDGGATWAPATVTGTTWSYVWTVTTTDVDSITARATDKAGNQNTATVNVTVSPKLFSGEWSYTYTPITGGGSVKTGTVTLTADDAGNVRISIKNSCGTHFDGTFTGMSAVLTTINNSLEDNGVETCAGTGTIILNFTDMKYAAGTVTTPDSTATLKLTSHQVLLTWAHSASPILAGYKIYLGTVSGAYTQSDAAGKVTSYTIGNLSPGTRYYFALTTYDSYGNESPFSKELSVSIP